MRHQKPNPPRPLRRPAPKGILLLLLPAAAAALLSASCVFETRPEHPGILFMGNSITQNAPAPESGWPHDWGMAATARERDYVHQTVRLLEERGMPLRMEIAGKPCPDCDGALDEQANNMEQVRRFRPRYVVVQLSEHSHDIELRSGKMTAQYRTLLANLAKEGVRHIYCVGAWTEKVKGGAYSQYIRMAVKDFPEAEFVDIHEVAALPGNDGDPALFDNPHVLWHPGDSGMLGIARLIADAVWEDR